MIPIALAAEGFGPFRDRIDVDFEDAEFFALAGPTGSGQSSVVDAMCFALYGFVPRYGDQRLVSPAVTLGAQQAKVQFTFEAAGERYVATRVVRRTSRGGATTRECRLERLVDGGSVVLAADPREADRMVQEVLGLSPEHLTRCVVLPQGEFSRFLHDKPSDRQEILVKLLGLEVYGAMAPRARARAAEAKTRAASRWRPVPRRTDAAPAVVFVDGVRRVEARVWFFAAGAQVEPGLAASYAAGGAVCDGAARIDHVVVERGLFTASPAASDVRTPCGEVFRARMAAGGELEALSAALQQRMRAAELDVAVAARASAPQGNDDLLVVDGPLRGRENLPRAIGYVKTHQASYLPPEQHAVVAQLGAGERTPVFTRQPLDPAHVVFAVTVPRDAPVGRDRPLRVRGGPGAAGGGRPRRHVGRNPAGVRLRGAQGRPGAAEPLPDRRVGADAAAPARRPDVRVPGTVPRRLERNVKGTDRERRDKTILGHVPGSAMGFHSVSPVTSCSRNVRR